MPNRKLTELKNIGVKIADRLNQVGIFSEDELRFYGSVATHKMLKKEFQNEVLPVCYYLYSFEGALLDQHWNDISEGKKQSLRRKIDLSVK